MVSTVVDTQIQWLNTLLTLTILWVFTNLYPFRMLTTLSHCCTAIINATSPCVSVSGLKCRHPKTRDLIFSVGLYTVWRATGETRFVQGSIACRFRCHPCQTTCLQADRIDKTIQVFPHNEEKYMFNPELFVIPRIVMLTNIPLAIYGPGKKSYRES